MIISVDTKNVTKIQHFFTIKTLNKLKAEGNFFNLIKGVYNKVTANTILNDERLTAFLHRSE